MRSSFAERRAIEKERDAAWAMLKNVSSRFVDTLEHLESALEVIQDTQGAEVLSVLLQQAWEQIEETGVQLNGKPGERFDPKRHRIVKEVPGPEVSHRSVRSVVCRGISCLGRSVRPADVVVEIPLSKERGE
jgi:molecular chaperone GrpE (heat shock protein)